MEDSAQEPCVQLRGRTLDLKYYRCLNLGSRTILVWPCHQTLSPLGKESGKRNIECALIALFSLL